MKERRLRQRWPWIAIEATDIAPQGPPETVVWLPGRETIEGLHIRGLDPQQPMLGIRTKDGEPMTCAIADDVPVDTHNQVRPR